MSSCLVDTRSKICPSVIRCFDSFTSEILWERGPGPAPSNPGYSLTGRDPVCTQFEILGDRVYVLTKWNNEVWTVRVLNRMSGVEIIGHHGNGIVGRKGQLLLDPQTGNYLVRAGTNVKFSEWAFDSDGNLITSHYQGDMVQNSGTGAYFLPETIYWSDGLFLQANVIIPTNKYTVFNWSRSVLYNLNTPFNPGTTYYPVKNEGLLSSTMIRGQHDPITDSGFVSAAAREQHPRNRAIIQPAVSGATPPGDSYFTDYELGTVPDPEVPGTFITSDEELLTLTQPIAATGNSGAYSVRFPESEKSTPVIEHQSVVDVPGSPLPIKVYLNGVLKVDDGTLINPTSTPMPPSVQGNYTELSLTSDVQYSNPAFDTHVVVFRGRHRDGSVADVSQAAYVVGNSGIEGDTGIRVRRVTLSGFFGDPVYPLALILCPEPDGSTHEDITYEDDIQIWAESLFQLAVFKLTKQSNYNYLGQTLGVTRFRGSYSPYYFGWGTINQDSNIPYASVMINGENVTADVRNADYMVVEENKALVVHEGELYIFEPALYADYVPTRLPLTDWIEGEVEIRQPLLVDGLNIYWAVVIGGYQAVAQFTLSGLVRIYLWKRSVLTDMQEFYGN